MQRKEMKSTEVQNLAHACIRCPIATLWYICKLVALNATKYVTVMSLQD